MKRASLLCAFVLLVTVLAAGSVTAKKATLVTTGETGRPITVGPAVVPAATQDPPVMVTTYHYDTLRTGWNPQETALTATGFPDGKSSPFGVIATQSGLDDQIDVQPLVIPGLTIPGQGTHDVVYVATESNTIYALDASTGAILLSTNLGTPVPTASLPGNCGNNGPNVGINGTPVIDPATKTLYVIAYVNVNGTPNLFSPCPRPDHIDGQGYSRRPRHSIA